MSSVNKVILLGNLGKDPEVRAIKDGKKVANFSIATTESYTDKSGVKQNNTEWHNIVFFGGLAEVAEKFLKKGSQVYIEGKIKTSSYDNKDGVKVYKTEVYGDSMQMLGSPKNGTAKQSTPKETANVGGDNFDTSNDVDDLPF